MDEQSKSFEEFSHPADWLMLEYGQRRQRNPYYSLRAFARYLQIPSGPLSEILQKKRKITPKMARRIASRFGLSLSEQDSLLSLIDQTWSKSPAPKPASQKYNQLASDQFRLIADWYHFALLSLMETVDFRNSPKWISQRLGISTTEVRAAIDRLLRLGMIKRDKRRLVPVPNWSTSSDIPSSAGRQFLRQSLEQATTSLENTPIEERDVTSITMAVDPNNLKVAKKLIRQFRRKLAGVLESGSKTQVYKLNIQLFPLTEDR